MFLSAFGLQGREDGMGDEGAKDVCSGLRSLEHLVRRLAEQIGQTRVRLPRGAERTRVGCLRELDQDLEPRPGILPGSVPSDRPTDGGSVRCDGPSGDVPRTVQFQAVCDAVGAGQVRRRRAWGRWQVRGANPLAHDAPTGMGLGAACQEQGWHQGQ